MFQIELFNAKGAFQSLPIFSLGLSCQTTLFVLIGDMSDFNVIFMDSVVAGAVNLCTCVYTLVCLRFCCFAFAVACLSRFSSSVTATTWLSGRLTVQHCFL